MEVFIKITAIITLICALIAGIFGFFTVISPDEQTWRNRKNKMLAALGFALLISFLGSLVKTVDDVASKHPALGNLAEYNEITFEEAKRGEHIGERVKISKCPVKSLSDNELVVGDNEFSMIVTNTELGKLKKDKIEDVTVYGTIKEDGTFAVVREYKETGGQDFIALYCVLFFLLPFVALGVFRD